MKNQTLLAGLALTSIAGVRVINDSTPPRITARWFRERNPKPMKRHKNRGTGNQGGKHK